MTRHLHTLKSALLIAALLIVGISAGRQVVYAGGVVCEGDGHSCHVIVGDTMYHYIEYR